MEKYDLNLWLAPPGPTGMREQSEDSKVVTNAEKSLRVLFRTNGFSRIFNNVENPIASINGDAFQCSPTQSLDPAPQEKERRHHILVETIPDRLLSSLRRRNVSPKRMLQAAKGERQVKGDGNDCCDMLSPGSFSKHAKFQDVPSLPNLDVVPALHQKDGNIDGVSSSDCGPDKQLDRESTAVTDRLLPEASASHQLSRKGKAGSTHPSGTAALISSKPDKASQKEEVHPRKYSVSKNGLVETAEEVVRNTPILNCRLPANGEDVEHFRHCEIVSTGHDLRQLYIRWFTDIPSHCGIMRVVDLITGSSCQRILLNGECSEENCLSKHVIDLNFSFPPAQFSRVFKVFIKWFLVNSVQPDFKAILLILSRLPVDSNDTLMIVLSCTKMMMKLSNTVYKRALGIKLIDILVNILGHKPWDAVKSLLVFFVAPETEPPEMLGFLSHLEVLKNKSLKNHLHETVSCLWHMSESFVCPSDLLFELVKECLVQMPPDLKLTKERILLDLLKLPRCLLRKEFTFIDKFLSKYFPQNSKIAHRFRTRVLYGLDVSESASGCGSNNGSYSSQRVKGTGPVNPQWNYWDIQESRIKAFDLVVKNSQKCKSREKNNLRSGPMCDMSKENLEVDLWSHDLFKMMASRNCLCYDKGSPSYDFSIAEPNELECLVKSITTNKPGKVVRIMLSCSKSFNPDAFKKCLRTLQQEFELCDTAQIGLVVFEILKRLPGSLSDERSVKSCFVRMVNSLVVKFYKAADYKSALKLLKTMTHAEVNHLEHPPKETNQQTFAIICCDINFKCRLYRDAIRTLMYKNCLSFVNDGFDRRFPEHFHQLEKLVMSMIKRFLRERHASHAMDIFRLIFAAQENFHFPLNIGKYYEGVIFLSFVRNLKKNACSIGDGANLYIAVERICGNSVPFHSITYRSLLVELHRANSPEDIIRRTLRICLKKKIYPDFSRGPPSPLVLDSHLSQEEMSIYLKHYFAYFVVQGNLQQLTDRPLIVQFTESPPPDKKLFPVSNDIMKTPRSTPEALQRFKSVLDGFSSELNQTLDADYHQDRVTIPVQVVEKLLGLFKR